MKKVFMILGMIGLIIFVLGCTIIIWLKWMAKQPIVKEVYYSQLFSRGELEEKYAALGEYSVSSLEFDSNEEYFKKYKVWYPSSLEGGNKQYPLVIMVNGTGVPYKKYEPIFEHLASWGFVVIGNDNEAAGDGKSSSLALDFMLSLNNDSKSIFYNKIDTEAIGISGHSQGGVGAIRAVTDFENSNMYKTIYTASATTISMIQSWNLQGWEYDISKITIPIFMTAATGNADANTISPLKDMQQNFDDLNDSVMAIMARRKDSDHKDMLVNADSYMTAWFRYILMNDIDAAKIFEGNNAEIINNIDNWQDVQRQNIKYEDINSNL